MYKEFKNIKLNKENYAICNLINSLFMLLITLKENIPNLIESNVKTYESDKRLIFPTKAEEERKTIASINKLINKKTFHL